jgi:simple sugar transport system substrate-binding protein
MNRRALLPLLTVLAASLWLASCNGKGSAGGEPIVLGFSQAGLQPTLRAANRDSIKTAAAEAGIQLRFEEARDTQEAQVEALRSLIAQHVDVIAFSPAAETGWDTVLREAKKAGIPVVLTERAVRVGDRSLYTTVLETDFVEQGRNAGRWLLENTLGRSRKINIVVLEGTAGSQLANDRQRGFREVIDTDPNFQIIRSDSGDFTRTGGKAAMRKLLKAEGRRINVLFAHSDEMALGAIQAIEEARLRPGKDIVIISIDGVKEAFEAMIAGKLNVTVESNPLIGPKLMGVTKDLVAHRRLPHRLVVEDFVYPMELAREVLPTRKY